MGPTLLAAIIGGLFAIVAALLPFLMKRREKSVKSNTKNYDITWWQQQAGKQIFERDYSRGFSSIIGDHAKKQILLRIKYHKGKRNHRVFILSGKRNFQWVSL